MTHPRTLSVLLVASVVASLPAVAQAYDVNAGKTEATTVCFMCHGQDGSGTSMAPPIRFIADTFPSVPGLANVIQLRMPPPGNSLTAEQATNVAAFLFTLAGKDPGAASSQSTMAPPPVTPIAPVPVPTTPPATPLNAVPPTGTYTATTQLGKPAAATSSSTSSSISNSKAHAPVTSLTPTPVNTAPPYTNSSAAPRTPVSPPVYLVPNQSQNNSLLLTALLAQAGLIILFLGFLYLIYFQPNSPRSGGRHRWRPELPAGEADQTEGRPPGGPSP